MPISSAYERIMRTHILWIVHTHERDTSTIFESLSFISLAALLVNVIAKIACGGTFFSSTR